MTWYLHSIYSQNIGGSQIDIDVNLEESNNTTMADSGNGSASSFSLTDSGDTIHQTPNYVVALHRKMVMLLVNKKFP